MNDHTLIGRELDAAVARALGCNVEASRHGESYVCGCPQNADNEYPHGFFVDGIDTCELAHYSTDFDAAWRAVEASGLLAPDTQNSLHGHVDGWAVTKDVTDYEDYYASACHETLAVAPTMPLAVCYALLKFLEKKS